MPLLEPIYVVIYVFLFQFIWNITEICLGGTYSNIYLIISGSFGLIHACITYNMNNPKYINKLNACPISFYWVLVIFGYYNWTSLVVVEDIILWYIILVNWFFDIYILCDLYNVIILNLKQSILSSSLTISSDTIII